MKIVVAKADLEVALGITKIATSSGQELSSHYLFRIRNGIAEVLTCDQRVFARSPLVATVDGPDGAAFTVETWRLDKWVSSISDGTVTLSSETAGEVQVSLGRSKTRFRSLDPNKFPYWDSTLEKAKVTGSAPPQVLFNALSLIKNFVATDEAKPELCQAETVNGVLKATDKRTLSIVDMPSLPNVNARLPGKTIPTLLKFLGDKHTEGLIKVREAESEGLGVFAVFEREDGSYLGVMRPANQYPDLTLDRNAKGDASLQLDVSELATAFSVLSSGAPKGTTAVTFNHKDGVVSLEMESEAGGQESYLLTEAKVTNPSGFTAPFTLDYPYIKGISDAFKLEKFDLELTRMSKGGYSAFKHVDQSANGNIYTTVLVWKP